MTPSSTPPPNRPPARAPRDAEAGIARPGGFLVAALTAAVVFGIGQRLLPRHAPEAPVAPAPAPPPPAPAPTPPPPIVDAATSAHPDGMPPTLPSAASDAARDGRIAGSDARDATAASPDLARNRAEDTDEAARPGPPTRKPAEGDREERPADKDLAREAWRRNRPDVGSDGGKASILIPIKGSIAGAGFRVTNRPHAVIVTLPKAASLITMRLYRVNRDGFRLLWINQAEKDADPNDGTSFKIGLADLSDPLVEIKDDFVRVTVHRPAADAPAPERGAAPKASHDSARAPKAATHDSPPAPKGGATHDDVPAPKAAPAPDPSAD